MIGVWLAHTKLDTFVFFDTTQAQDFAIATTGSWLEFIHAPGSVTNSPSEPQTDAVTEGLITAQDEPQSPKLDPDNPMALYEAAVEKMTPAQGRMIWSLITKQYDFTKELDAKMIIKGIVAQQHEGYELASTKELSKVWAIGVIDYLQKHTKEDLQQWIIPF